MALNILYIANRLKAFGNSGYDRPSILRALQKDHNVDAFEDFPRIIDKDYDLCLIIVGCGCTVKPQYFKRLKPKCVVVTWCLDDGVRFEQFKSLMFSADIAITIDYKIKEKYSKVNYLHYLPPAADPKYCINKHIPLKDRKYKISFVGNCSYQNRAEMISLLSMEFGNDFQSFGWKSPHNNREIDYNEYMDIVNDTVVNLNITWRGVMNNRMIEVPMSGNILLSDKVYKEPNLPIFHYDLGIDLINKINHILKYPEEYLEYVNDFSGLLDSYTWKNRIKQVLKLTK